MQQLLCIQVLDKDSKESIILRDTDQDKVPLSYDTYEEMIQAIFNDPDFHRQFADKDGFLECMASILDTDSHRYLHTYLKVHVDIIPNMEAE